VTPSTDQRDAAAMTPSDVEAGIVELRDQLSRATDDWRRAECMARIQSNAVQLALDLLVREPDIEGFFRVFIKTLVEESESHACGVWLVDAEGRVDMWMAVIGDRFYARTDPEWATVALPRDAMAAHLADHVPGWTETIDYDGQDPRLPAPVREFNREMALGSLVVTPLVLPTRNLGWVALSAAHGLEPECESLWRRALTEAMARQATLALHQSRMAEQSLVEARRQAVLEERNRLARDIHDTLAQGFAAILMQLQAAQRSTSALPPTVATALETAVDLARGHMIEARRSVGALRPQAAGDESLPVALHRMTELARRTTDMGIELTIEALPPLGGMEREIIGIAQEALTNAVRHSRGRTVSLKASAVRAIGFRLSVADDGRGIAREHRSRGFGMTSMQERAERIGASLTVVTAPRAGTEVVLAWEPPSFSIPAAADAG